MFGTERKTSRKGRDHVKQSILGLAATALLLACVTVCRAEELPSGHGVVRVERNAGKQNQFTLMVAVDRDKGLMSTPKQATGGTL